MSKKTKHPFALTKKELRRARERRDNLIAGVYTRDECPPSPISPAAKAFLNYTQAGSAKKAKRKGKKPKGTIIHVTVAGTRDEDKSSFAAPREWHKHLHTPRKLDEPARVSVVTYDTQPHPFAFHSRREAEVFIQLVLSEFKTVPASVVTYPIHEIGLDALNTYRNLNSRTQGE